MEKQTILKDLILYNMLFIPDDQLIAIQVNLKQDKYNLSPELDSDSYSVEILSQIEIEIEKSDQFSDIGESSWMKHASGFVKSGNIVGQGEFDIEESKQIYTQEMDIKNLYQLFLDIGLEYSGDFRGINNLWVGDHGALSYIDIDIANQNVSKDFLLYPASLDSCFQSLIALEMNNKDINEESEIYLPINIKECRIATSLGRQSIRKVWSKSYITKMNSNIISGFISIFDPNSTFQIAEILDINLKKTNGMDFKKKLEYLYNRGEEKSNLLEEEKCLYEIEWKNQLILSHHEASENGYEEKLEINRNWIILCDRNHGIGKFISIEIGNKSKALVTLRSEVVSIYIGEEYERLKKNSVNSENIIKIKIGKEFEEFERLFSEELVEWKSKSKMGLGVIHLWNLDLQESYESMAKGERNKTQLLGCGSILSLVHKLIMHMGNKKMEMWLVSQGAQCIKRGMEELGNYTVSISQSPMWGLGKVVTLEYPDIKCVLVDLDPTQNLEKNLSTTTKLLLKEIFETNPIFEAREPNCI